MSLPRVVALFAALACIASSELCGADELTSEQCAAQVQRATVTVRVRLHPEVKEAEPKLENDDASTHVTVCSGVAVSETLLVTAAFAAADSQIRITLPGGEQTSARLRVLDEFSGLALLEAKDIALSPLSFADAAPVAGGWLMTAAGWGAEQPLVSVGIVGGVDRAIKGYVYPPLLQCDVRPAETSSGAAIIDRQGKMLGVIVAGDSPDVNRGWLYAVPASHVQRLLRARNDKASEDTVVVLKRKRPFSGLSLDPTDAGVMVSKVVPDSPAAKAGVQKGDRIVSAEGKNVRYVYEAVRPTLYKQPGDTMTFVVQRGDEQVKIEFVLGGGVELPSASLSKLGQLVAPKIDIVKRNGTGSAQAEVRVQESYPAAPQSGPEKDATSLDKLRLLEKANDRYRSVIEEQQRELLSREADRRQQSAALEALKAELESIKKKSDR